MKKVWADAAGSSLSSLAFRHWLFYASSFSLLALAFRLLVSNMNQRNSPGCNRNCFVVLFISLFWAMSCFTFLLPYDDKFAERLVCYVIASSVVSYVIIKVASCVRVEVV